MPPPASRWASTLASTGAPAATATPTRRAMSPGLAAGSRPTLLSPHTTRSGRAPAGRVRLSRSLAENRSSTGPTTPGWTNATRTVPAGGGRRPQRPEGQRGQGEGDRRRGRRRPGRAGDPPADGGGDGHVDRHQQEAQPPDATDERPPTTAPGRSTGWPRAAPRGRPAPPRSAAPPRQRTRSGPAPSRRPAASAPAVRRPRAAPRRASRAAATARPGAWPAAP